MVSASKAPSNETRYFIRDFGHEDQTPFLVVHYAGVEVSVYQFQCGFLFFFLGKHR